MINLTVTEINITNKAMAYLPHGQLPFHDNSSISYTL